MTFAELHKKEERLGSERLGELRRKIETREAVLGVVGLGYVGLSVAPMLAGAGVGMGIFYPIPAHQQGYMREFASDVFLPVAEQLAKEVTSLPVHPLLTPEDLQKIVAEVNRL